VIGTPETGPRLSFFPRCVRFAKTVMTPTPLSPLGLPCSALHGPDVLRATSKLEALPPFSPNRKIPLTRWWFTFDNDHAKAFLFKTIFLVVRGVRQRSCRFTHPFTLFLFPGTRGLKCHKAGFLAESLVTLEEKEKVGSFVSYVSYGYGSV